jgi:hypothetical protein
MSYRRVPLQFPLSAAATAERVIGAIRDEVGTACDIIIGTHGQMTAAGALRIAARLEKFDLLWFEEPCPPENMKALAEVARRTTIPIATGERLTTKFDFARLLEHRAAAIFNFDAGQVGGLLEAKKIASMAEAHYVQVAPHVYGGPFIAAAALHLSLCSPNFLIMEAVERFDGVHARFVDPPFEWHDGYLMPPRAPASASTCARTWPGATPRTGRSRARSGRTEKARLPLPLDDVAGRVPGEVGQRGEHLLLAARCVGDDEPKGPPVRVDRGVHGAHRDVDRVALGHLELLVFDRLRPVAGNHVDELVGVLMQVPGVSLTGIDDHLALGVGRPGDRHR